MQQADNVEEPRTLSFGGTVRICEYLTWSEKYATGIDPQQMTRKQEEDFPEMYAPRDPSTVGISLDLLSDTNWGMYLAMLTYMLGRFGLTPATTSLVFRATEQGCTAYVNDVRL